MHVNQWWNRFYPDAPHNVCIVGKGSSVCVRVGRGADRDTINALLQVINISRNTDVILKAFQQAIHEK